jgi:uncharacterized membrane protein YfcA
MATILFTSVSSVRAHEQHRAVNWKIVRRMAAGIIVGTFGGALLASVLDLRLLTIVFTILIYYLSAQMLFGRKPQPGTMPQTVTGTSLTSAGIGIISSLTATGGAALVIAYLVKRGTRIHEAIGTAAAIGWPLAASGTAGYVLTGWGRIAGIQRGLCLPAGARRHCHLQHAAGPGRRAARPPHAEHDIEKDLRRHLVPAGDENARELFLALRQFCPRAGG